jgi:hypothetical protein
MVYWLGGYSSIVIIWYFFRIPSQLNSRLGFINPGKACSISNIQQNIGLWNTALWRFPKIGVPPNHSRIFHYKPSSYWGYPHWWKPTYQPKLNACHSPTRLMVWPWQSFGQGNAHQTQAVHHALRRRFFRHPSNVTRTPNWIQCFWDILRSDLFVGYEACQQILTISDPFKAAIYEQHYTTIPSATSVGSQNLECWYHFSVDDK